MEPQKIAEELKAGKIAVVPTDTMYGLVGSALSPEVVERIYAVRERDIGKPLIILIKDLSDLTTFGVDPFFQENELLRKIWPGKVSVILPCLDERFAYLHRGTKTLAFRVPADPFIHKILSLAGPLVAPSANMQGNPPAKTIEEARSYFGEQVDLYVDAGPKSTDPSTLISFENGKIKIIRQGDFIIPEN